MNLRKRARHSRRICNQDRPTSMPLKTLNNHQTLRASMPLEEKGQMVKWLRPAAKCRRTFTIEEVDQLPRESPHLAEIILTLAEERFQARKIVTTKLSFITMKEDRREDMVTNGQVTSHAMEMKKNSIWLSLRLAKTESWKVMDLTMVGTTNLKASTAEGRWIAHKPIPARRLSTILER